MTRFNSETNGKEIVEAFSSRVDGKTIVITGPSTGGIGSETAISLASANPKQLILAGRTEAKITPVLEEISKINPSISTKFVQLDLGDQSSVRKAAAEISSSVEKIDLLINNAGIMAVPVYETTTEGIESQFGTNHIGHFLFTNLLMDKILAAGKGARIVNVSSMGYNSSQMRFDDYNFQDGKVYNPWFAYGQAKTANILFTVALAEKLKSKGIVALTLHPGVIPTKLSRRVDKDLMAEGWKIATEQNGGKTPQMGGYKTLQQGCATTLAAALDPSFEESSGAFLRDCSYISEPIRADAKDPKNAEKLWELSEKLVGQKFAI